MAVNTVKVNINSQNYNLSYNETSGKWEATITAPNTTSWNETNNKYGVTVTATDEAGNSTVKDRTDATLGESLQLRVLEKTKPTINVTAPSSGATLNNSTPIIEFELRDEVNGSGIDISTLELKIDGGTAKTNGSPGMVCNSVTNGYNCSYQLQSALSEGSHTVTISIKDCDGNVSNLASVSFTIDTAPPTLNISNPSEGLITKTTSISVAGTTNDDTSTPVTITIKLNDVDQGAVSVSEGSFSKSINLSEGSNTIVVRATDASGLYSEVTRHVTLDTQAPNITAVTITPNPVDCGQTYVIAVTVSD